MVSGSSEVPKAKNRENFVNPQNSSPTKSVPKIRSPKLIPQSLTLKFPFLLPGLLALAGGVLMGLTPAPNNAWFLAWIALAPLWISLVGDRQEAMGKGRTAICALLWGIGYHGIVLFWLTGVHPMTWMGVPWLASLAIALFCWIFVTLWGAALVTSWALIFRWLCTRGSHHSVRDQGQETPSVSRGLRWAIAHQQLPFLRILTGTALWCALETLWSYGPLYWSSLSYTQSPHNLIILHLGQLSGPMTVTAAIVAVNGFLAEAWIASATNPGSIPFPTSHSSSWRSNLHPASPSPTKYLGVAFSLFLLFHLMGYGLYSRPLIQPTEAELKIGIIQGNIPNTIKLYEDGWRRAIAGYTAGYEALATQGVDAVLTPETALPVVWAGPTRDRSPFYQAILDRGVVAWVGAFGESGRDIANSLFTVGSKGQTLSEYRKSKLVPLGEYIPFQGLLGGLINRLSPLDAHLVPGSSNQRFDTPFGQAIVSICYESAYPQHFREQAAAGGQFILTASNNAHYNPSMPAQHHAQDIIRAIETDRWAARATNTGYSGIVDPHGRTRWLSRLNTYEVHAATIYRRQTQTFYVRWGDWLTPLLGLLTLGAWASVYRVKVTKHAH